MPEVAEFPFLRLDFHFIHGQTFNFSCLVNNVVMNWRVLIEILTSLLPDTYPEVGSLDQLVVLFFQFLRPFHTVFQSGYTTLQWAPFLHVLSSTSLLTLVCSVRVRGYCCLVYVLPRQAWSTFPGGLVMLSACWPFVCPRKKMSIWVLWPF